MSVGDHILVLNHTPQFDDIQFRILCLLCLFDQVWNKEQRHAHGCQGKSGHPRFFVSYRRDKIPIGRTGSQIQHIYGILLLAVKSIEDLTVRIRSGNGKYSVEISEEQSRNDEKHRNAQSRFLFFQ